MPASHWLSQILASQTSHLQERADAKSKRVDSIATCMMLCGCSDIKVYFPALLVCGMHTCIQMVERQGPKHKSAPALDAFPVDREPTRHIRAKVPLYSVTLILIFKIGGVPDNECHAEAAQSVSPNFSFPIPALSWVFMVAELSGKHPHLKPSPGISAPMTNASSLSARCESPLEAHFSPSVMSPSFGLLMQS